MIANPQSVERPKSKSKSCFRTSIDILKGTLSVRAISATKRLATPTSLRVFAPGRDAMSTQCIKYAAIWPRLNVRAPGSAQLKMRRAPRSQFLISPTHHSRGNPRSKAVFRTFVWLCCGVLSCAERLECCLHPAAREGARSAQEPPQPLCWTTGRAWCCASLAPFFAKKEASR